ncbi:MAG: hypothetical protein KAH44_22610, partial [Oricola sp.]|nr:hypothetical protein [Oricola sp.]
YGYGYQAAHYMDARAQLVRLIKEGRVFGDVNAGFLAEIEKAGDAYEFVFVFMQTIGSPRALPIRFPQGTTVHGKFQQEIEQSVAVYRDYRERFGDGMWVEVDELWRPSDEELAALMWS